MIKLVVFDWNGTLFSDANACMAADNHILKFYGGKPVNLKTFRETIIIPARDFYVRHGVKIDRLIKNSEEQGEVFHSFYEERAKKCRARKGAREILKWLKSNSVNSIILSNHTTRGIAFQLDRLKFGGYIETVLANSELDTAMKKRNKFEKLKDYIKTKNYGKDEILIVGDSPEEAEIAKGLGIKSVLITDGYYSNSRLRDSKPDYIIKNLKQLKKIIK